MSNEKLIFELEGRGNLISMLQQSTGSVRKFDSQVKQSMRTLNKHNQITTQQSKNYKFLRGAAQQLGFQIGDYAVQVANGTSKMQAFGQQGAQMLGVFGPIGALLGAGVAIFSAIGVAASKSGREIKDLGSALGVLQEPLTQVKDAVMSMRDAFGSVMPFIVNNIDTALIAAGLFGAYMAGKYVFSLAAATASTITFTSSMYALGVAVGTVKKLLVRFLPFAVLLAMAKAIEMFLQLKKGVGSFGEALGLVKDVAVEALGRIGTALSAMSASISSAFYGMKGDALLSLQGIVDSVTGFANNTVNTFEGALNAVVAAWNTLPQAFKRLGAMAMNGLVDIFETGAKGIVETLNSILTFGGRKPEWAIGAPDLSEFKQQIPEAANVGQAMSEAFGKAFEDNPFTSQIDLTGAAAEALATSNTMADAANTMREAATAPLSSWERLKEAFKAGATEVSIFGDKTEEALGGGSGASNALKDMQQRVQSIADTMKDSMTDAFMSIVDGTKSAKEAFKAMARSIIAKLYEVLVVQRLVGQFNAATGKGSGIVGAIMGAFGKRATGGPITAGKPYMVGEKGPELVVPSRNGNVVPNNQLSGGGVTVNQNISFGAGVSRAEINAMLPKIVETTKAAVFDAQRRSVTGRGYA